MERRTKKGRKPQGGGLKSLNAYCARSGLNSDASTFIWGAAFIKFQISQNIRNVKNFAWIERLWKLKALFFFFFLQKEKKEEKENEWHFSPFYLERNAIWNKCIIFISHCPKTDKERNQVDFFLLGQKKDGIFFFLFFYLFKKAGRKNFFSAFFFFVWL